MGKQPDKVYSLDEATRILSDVIRGLEVVHTKGFLHRDVKVENILVKIDENGNKVHFCQNRNIKLQTLALVKNQTGAKLFWAQVAT